jgi:hypothetical protein
MTDDLRRRFDQVYAVHHAAILGYALRRAGDAHDAADVIAETSSPQGRRIYRSGPALGWGRQSGKPKGVVGPPGPMSFGYLTAGEAEGQGPSRPSPATHLTR